jgi:hypothetical protein
VPAYPPVRPVTEWHHYVGKPTLDLIVVGIRDPADILWLIAVPTCNVPLDPLPPLAFPHF